MHEMALVRDVVDMVNDYANKVQATAVRAVYLTIGDARDIVEDYFEGLFTHMTKDTLAEGAELVLLRSPIMVKCNQCGMPFHLDIYRSDAWLCPRCGAVKDYTFMSGLEFRIDQIEVECKEEMPAATQKAAAESSVAEG